MYEISAPFHLSTEAYECRAEYVVNRGIPISSASFASALLHLAITFLTRHAVSNASSSGEAYLNRYVKALAVSYDGGLHYAYPSVGTAADGSYPVVRPLYYYYDSSKEASLRGFLDYALSETGQELVLKEGFIPIAQEDDKETSGK